MKKIPYIFLLLSLLCAACNNQHRSGRKKSADLPQIKDSGELVVLTLYSSISYFNYRGVEMGFQYELGKQFAQSLGVKLRVDVSASIPEMIKKLNDGEGDIITYPLPVTNERKKELRFCGEEVVTHQVIVQRSYGKSKIIKDVTGLIGKDVYAKPGKYYDRLVNLNKELGGGIHIHKVDEDSISIEDLITKVSKGEISYTVCDNDVARLNKTYYHNLNISLKISHDQRSSWAVRKKSPLLAKAVNEWHKVNQTSPEYTAVMKRYFETSKLTVHAPILSVKDGKISPFDDLFRRYAKEIEWDWRLLASLAYTESNFDPAAESWVGAKGLMQLMPGTATAMGVPEGMITDPEENIKAAVKLIASMDKSLSSIENRDERIKFILASYNAGLGHIYDAMALAGKHGKDPLIWYNNAESCLMMKSSEEYYNDPVCKHGYFRGVQTYNFVREIVSRFDIYKEKIK